MTDELHDTHQWGERDVDGQTIPVCTVCKTDGYENEPAAFAPCRPKNWCGVTMNSWDNPGHVHVCGTAHDTGDHHCADCRIWFHP